MGGRRGSTHRPIEERFWRAVDTSGDCWTWKLSTVGGYGQIAVSANRAQRAHRFSWELHFGPIPDGLVVCHACDNRLCVRPDHLWLGTQADNLRDMREKGRAARLPVLLGEANHATHLTADDVAAIRSDARPSRAVARTYGVGKSTILRIRRGEVWRTAA